MTTPSAVPDVLAPGLDVVFCGINPGYHSDAKAAHFANPRNDFWRLLHAAGFTPRRFLPSEYAQLLALGIGLTDLCKGHSGNDDELPRGALDADSLRAKIAEYRPAVVAFTSKNAAKAFLGRDVDYGWQPEREGTTRLFVLPSPSGQATRFWDEGPWLTLARWLHGHEAGAP